LDAAEAGITCRRYSEPAYALGLAISFLTARNPFSAYRAGQLVSSVAGQIRRGHYLFAMRGARIVGYAGWGLCSSELAERHLRGEYNPSFAECRDGEVVLMMIVATSEPAALRPIVRSIRARYPGRSYVGKRVRPDGLRPRRVSSRAACGPVESSPRLVHF